MKKVIAVLALAAMSAMAGDFRGYIVDKGCATRRGMLGDVACAKRCIARGDQAILSTEDGKLYGIANQERVKEFAGRKVTVTGRVDNKGWLTVETIEEAN